MHLGEPFASIHACLDAHAARHHAGEARRRLGECVQQRPRAVGRHLGLLDRAVLGELYRLDARLAKRMRRIGGAVVHHIPLAVLLDDSAMVVPGIGIAAEVVDDHATVRIGSERFIRSGVSDARRAAMPGDVRKHEVVRAAALRELYAFVEVMARLVDHPFVKRAGLNAREVWFEHRALRGELSPEVVQCAVVVTEYGWVYLLGPRVGERRLERSRDGVGGSHALPVRLVGHAVEDAPFTVVEDRIGRVEGRVGSGDAVVRANGRENAAPYRPRAEIACLEDVRPCARRASRTRTMRRQDPSSERGLRGTRPLA